jgi:hypothetical protein
MTPGQNEKHRPLPWMMSPGKAFPLSLCMTVVCLACPVLLIFVIPPACLTLVAVIFGGDTAEALWEGIKRKCTPEVGPGKDGLTFEDRVNAGRVKRGLHPIIRDTPATADKQWLCEHGHKVHPLHTHCSLDRTPASWRAPTSQDPQPAFH